MPRKISAESGFTLIELLTVMSVLAALSSIALPSFLRQTNRAQDARAISAVTAAAGAVSEYRTDHETFQATPAELAAIDPSLSEANNLRITGGHSTYRLTVDSLSGTVFAIELRGGRQHHECSVPGAGACNDDGTW